MESGTLRQLVKRAVRKLPEDLRTVLTLRYGIGDSGRQSFGKIAKQLHVKSSQVARMETKAVRKLRNPALCAPFIKVLDEMDPFIWYEISEEISEAGRLIRKSECYDRAMEALPGEISLAIRCAYTSLPNWIECNAVQAENAWFRSLYPPEMAKDRLQQLETIWNSCKTPFMVGYLADELHVDLAFLVLLTALSPFISGFYGGYAAERPITSPVLRAIRLHRLLLHRHQEALTLNQMAKDYNAAYHDDQLNNRIAEEILRSRPHLFFEAGEQTWSALGSSWASLPFTEVDDVVWDTQDLPAGECEKQPAFFFERPWSETTASDIVREILDERVFCQKMELLKTFLERTGGRYQVITGSAVLATNEDVLEAAPLLYGLRRTCGEIDPVNGWSEHLLTRRACKSFVLHRYAGEPLNIYPLWTPAMEYQWCIWAEANMGLNRGKVFGGESATSFNRKLLQSLLFISEPERWPVSDSIKTLWLFKKQALAEYQFEKHLPSHLLQWQRTLQDLFSAAVIFKRLGYANWIRIRYMLGLGNFNLNAAETLALLIALEMILPAENWQKKHETGPRMDAVLLVMTEEIRKKGFVHWMDEGGKEIRSRLRERLSRIELGWVSADWIRRFLDSLDGVKSPEQKGKKSSPSQPMNDAAIQVVSAQEYPVQAPEQLRLPF